MASRVAPPPEDEDAIADRWIAAYCKGSVPSDVMCSALAGPGNQAWRAMLAEVARACEGNLDRARTRVERQSREIGTAFRLPEEETEREWPLSPLPLMLDESEWDAIAAGIVQRAQLMESLLGDIYGAQKLVGDGAMPAALLSGSPHFLRPMVGLKPPGGCHLHFYAADLGRGPGGEWRVLADHTRTPTGAGYALENRLAVSRVLGQLQQRLNIQRLAPFFADVRAGIAASCKRADPRIALLTPGRYNQSYAEQAHIARYLGLLLAEGGDLAVHEDKLYIRTIEGLKRVDAVWRRVDPRMLDPLTFDSRSRIGVPGLIDAMAAGNVVVANAPGAGVLEAPAFAAFLPRFSRLLTGHNLRIPNIATWWCGQDAERATVEARIDSMTIGPAFPDMPKGLGSGGARIGSEIAGADRETLLAELRRRPVDYIGQELVELSTMPTVDGGKLVPRPFMLRVFASRDANGNWSVMPGGFARLGEQADPRAAVMGAGATSADVCVYGSAPVAPVTLLSEAGAVAIRRNPGTLPSRVADNLYWLGRYLERAEAVLALVRAARGGSIEADGGAGLAGETVSRLAELILSSGAAEGRAERSPATIVELADAALDGPGEDMSIASLLAIARSIGEGSRERLSADFWQLLDAGMPRKGSMSERSSTLQERFSAFAGLAAEHMGRTDGWRFHDMGRRIERAINVCRLTAVLGHDEATVDDLAMLLDLANAQITYRQRYPTGFALAPARDLVALDPYNPRSLAFQIEAIAAHLAALPALGDDGMAEAQQREANALKALVSIAEAAKLDPDTMQSIEGRLYGLSDAIGRRFFLHGSETLRAAGLTLA